MADKDTTASTGQMSRHSKGECVTVVVQKTYLLTCSRKPSAHGRSQPVQGANPNNKQLLQPHNCSQKQRPTDAAETVPGLDLPMRDFALGLFGSSL
jgi:hypothetical protein